MIARLMQNLATARVQDEVRSLRIALEFNAQRLEQAEENAEAHKAACESFQARCTKLEEERDDALSQLSALRAQRDSFARMAQDHPVLRDEVIRLREKLHEERDHVERLQDKLALAQNRLTECVKAHQSTLFGESRRPHFVADVKDFMRLVGQPIPETPAIPHHDDGSPDWKTIHLRCALISEELDELTHACAKLDLPEIADAFADLLYVVVGGFIAFGIDPGPIWRAVHASNMTKRGGGLDANGKASKPEGWTPPDVATLLREQGWEA